MPYIDGRLRVALFPHSKAYASHPGELNFQLTSLCDTYLRRLGMSYETLNAVIGALECAKIEFYRQLAIPYEDRKLAENGDVYSR